MSEVKTWWPNVGDKLIMVASDTSISVHSKVGDVRTVVSVEDYVNIVELDTCSCDRTDGKGCRWSWEGSHMDKFAPFIEITPEEAAAAKPLPDHDVVADFFRVKS